MERQLRLSEPECNLPDAYSEFSRVLITQKYLVVGHTQMECDSMHSTIEGKMTVDIITPREYMIILQTASLKPKPYQVKVVKHDDLMKLIGAYFTSIRTGTKAGGPTVHDSWALQFSHDGKVQYKLSFAENSEWDALPGEPMAWIRMFQHALPIKERKFQDLQSMKYVMPVKCHHFFDNLPHS